MPGAPESYLESPSVFCHLFCHLELIKGKQRYNLVAQRLKRLPGMRETWVRSLGRERKWHPIPVLLPGRSPGEGNGTPLQYSCLENPMDTGAW